MKYIKFLLTSIILLTFVCLLSANEDPKNIFNVQDFGSKGNKELCTKAIQKAINKCHQAGGGTVYFEPGEYLSGTIELKDNVTLYLEAGATLYASRKAKDYPDKYNIYKQNDSGKKGKGTTPVLIYAKNANNISIEGKGTIHGQAKRTYEPLKSVDQFIKKETEIARQAGVEMKMYYKIKPYVSMIFLESCENIHINNISLIESMDWTLHFKWSDKIYVKGVYIESSLESGVNADGIDVDGCHDVVISDCIIKTGDDAIVLKSTVTFEKYRSCENVTVTNCDLTSTSSAFKLGTESFGDFRHILVNNCAIRNSNRGLGIIVRDGGTVSDVVFSNITMDLDRKHFNWWGDADPVWLVLKKRNKDSKLGMIRNVTFKNIIAHCQGTSQIEGYPGKPLDNITVSDMEIFMAPEDKPGKRAKYIFEAHDVNNLELNNVEANWDKSKGDQQKWEHAFVFNKVDGLRLTNLSGKQAHKNGSMIHLSEVKNAIIERCFAKVGNTTFITAKGDGIHNITINDNYTQNAEKVINLTKGAKKTAITKMK